MMTLATAANPAENFKILLQGVNPPYSVAYLQLKIPQLTNLENTQVFPPRETNVEPCLNKPLVMDGYKITVTQLKDTSASLIVSKENKNLQAAP